LMFYIWPTDRFGGDVTPPYRYVIHLLTLTPLYVKIGIISNDLATDWFFGEMWDRCAEPLVFTIYLGSKICVEEVAKSAMGIKTTRNQ